MCDSYVDPDIRYVIGRDGHLDQSHAKYLGQIYVVNTDPDVL